MTGKQWNVANSVPKVYCPSGAMAPPPGFAVARRRLQPLRQRLLPLRQRIGFLVTQQVQQF